MSQEPFNRPKITKFFEEGMLDNYSNGSFWFGTLKRYRKNETKAAGEPVESRFSDRREGIIERAYSFKGGMAININMGNIQITNCRFEGYDVDIMLNDEVNEFVFCASWGGYSRQQHLDIMNGAMSGDGREYEGNSKLTHFAEIDLLLFLEAIKVAAPRSPLWRTTLSSDGYLLHRRVNYGKTERFVSLPAVYQSNEIDPDPRDYLRMLFVKPKYFSPENEYRIVLRANAPYSLTDDPDGLPLKHKKLRRAIIKIGGLDHGLSN